MGRNKVPLLTAAEFERELLRRGCRKSSIGPQSMGTYWSTPEERYFMVPPPDQDGKYPAWVLDETIAVAGLGDIAYHGVSPRPFVGTRIPPKGAGKLAIEGKEYVMRDGDVVHYRVGA